MRAPGKAGSKCSRLPRCSRLIAGFVRSTRWRALLLIALGELYLRRHYVDLPMLVDMRLFRNADRARRGRRRGFAARARASDVRGYLRLAVAGIVLWSLGAWMLSAFGFGSLKILRAVHAAARGARDLPRGRRRSACFSGATLRDARRHRERAVVAALGAWFLCLAARTNVVSGFDAWWYGLRGEYALVATGSVFKSLELVAPVNYYPKLYELLLIPVSGLHDTSVIEGISIACSRCSR